VSSWFGGGGLTWYDQKEGTAEDMETEAKDSSVGTKAKKMKTK